MVLTSTKKYDIYEHKCLENIEDYTNKLVSVTTSKKIKYIIEAAMVSTPEGFAKNSPISPMISTPIKKPSAQKSLCMFTKKFEVKKMLTFNLEMQHLSLRQLDLEIHHGH